MMIVLSGRASDEWFHAAYAACEDDASEGARLMVSIVTEDGADLDERQMGVLIAWARELPGYVDGTFAPAPPGW